MYSHKKVRGILENWHTLKQERIGSKPAFSYKLPIPAHKLDILCGLGQLQEVEPDYFTVIYEYYLLGKDREEILEKEGISKKWFYVRISRGIDFISCFLSSGNN